MTSIDHDIIDRAVALHGAGCHCREGRTSLCRGLSIGIQAGRLAHQELGEDEPLLAVAESYHCAVDGIQAVTGCTTGGYNLLVRDWGKLAYTFYRTSDGKAVRLVWDTPLDPALRDLRLKVKAGEATDDERADRDRRNDAEVDRILGADPATLFKMTPVTAPLPVTPIVGPWTTCDRCGEHVMENRTRRLGGETVCDSCAEVVRISA